MPALYSVRPLPDLSELIGEDGLDFSMVNGMVIHGTLQSFNNITGNCLVTQLSPNGKLRTKRFFNACDVICVEGTSYIEESEDG